MVCGVSPVMRLPKLPIPVPFVVFVESATVGLVAISQHIPRAVTAEPPSAVTVPPLAADVEAIPLIDVVTTVGGVGGGVGGFPTIFVQAVPLYTCNSPVVPQLVHHTISPATGPVIALRCAYVIRGGKKPFVVEVISSCADAAEVAVPTATLPEKSTLPVTDNLFVGVNVPIPTLPRSGLIDRFAQAFKALLCAPIVAVLYRLPITTRSAVVAIPKLPEIQPALMLAFIPSFIVAFLVTIRVSVFVVPTTSNLVVGVAVPIPTCAKEDKESASMAEKNKYFIIFGF